MDNISRLCFEGRMEIDTDNASDGRSESLPFPRNFLLLLLAVSFLLKLPTRYSISSQITRNTTGLHRTNIFFFPSFFFHSSQYNGEQGKKETDDLRPKMLGYMYINSFVCVYAHLTDMTVRMLYL